MEDLSIEEIRMLAEAERQMDAGELAYVVGPGGRLVVQPEIMERFGLEAGQTVSTELCVAIGEAHLASCCQRKPENLH